MNKKEVSEIKKQFTPDNCAITRICCCYVDGEKNKKAETSDPFLSLPEEEYVDLLARLESGSEAASSSTSGRGYGHHHGHRHE